MTEFMLRSTITDKTFSDKLIPMYELQPLQIAKIVDSKYGENSPVVMRTASKIQFEVINLNVPTECWTDEDCDLLVAPIQEEIVYKLRSKS